MSVSLIDGPAMDVTVADKVHPEMQKPPGIACHDGLSISTSLGTSSRAVYLSVRHFYILSTRRERSREPTLPNSAPPLNVGGATTFQAIHTPQHVSSQSQR
jgi:hypothetical protein